MLRCYNCHQDVSKEEHEQVRAYFEDLDEEELMANIEYYTNEAQMMAEELVALKKAEKS